MHNSHNKLFESASNIFCLDPAIINIRKTVVVGVGLIGGSFIRAIHKYEQEYGLSKSILGKVVGVGRSQDNLIKAKQLAVIDDYSTNLQSAVEDADLIIIATPVGAMKEVFACIKNVLKPNCIITDVGSVKGEVINNARNILGPRIHQFIPAHPIAGTEHSGVEASFAELFQTRYTIVTALPENKAQDVDIINSLWAMTHCQLLSMTPQQHDKIFAFTSHLPHVLVYALMNTISGLTNKEDYLRVVAGGFLDYTRIASSDPVMWRDVCLSNKSAILDALQSYKNSIDEMTKLIENASGDELYDAFSDAKFHRDELIKKEHKRKNKT